MSLGCNKKKYICWMILKLSEEMISLLMANIP